MFLVFCGVVEWGGVVRDSFLSREATAIRGPGGEHGAACDMQSSFKVLKLGGLSVAMQKLE